MTKRDFLHKSIRPKVRAPKAVNLAHLCSQVEDQGRLGSCTAQSLAGNLEFLDNRADSRYGQSDQNRRRASTQEKGKDARRPCGYGRRV